ncbi:MAG: dihydrolipoamide acetyltransferase family protein [Pseudomonadota bacterium]
MGSHVVRTPDIGEGIAEVELVAWHVKVGDMVQEDQVLADVMTDKATVEIPSPVVGKVVALGAEVGKLISVGAELIRIEVEGTGNTKETVATSPPETVVPSGASAVVEAPVTSPAPAAPAPVALKNVPGPAAPQAPTRPAGEKPLASPAVRHRAWELGIELRFVHGSGPAGRILHEDLDVYLASRGQPAGTVRGSAMYAERHGEEQVPVIGLRRKIAQKMQEAKRRIPHFSYVEEIDVTELEDLRARLNAKYASSRGKLTMLPLLARAVVLAVRDFPQMNARFDDDAGVVTRYGGVHLGIAAQTDAGLMVPVLRHAESHDLWSTSAEIARLAEGARTGKAAREELSGSTITISSLGALGGIVTTPVINHPEVAIIGVNRVVERPMMRGGLVVARKMMNLSSSFDHRVIDGLHAAEFIQAIRATLEAPAMLLVE